MAMDYILQLAAALQPLSMTIFLSIVLLPLLLLLSITTILGRKKLPYPPGPKGLPLIGNVLIMDQLTHQGLAQLATQYGGLFRLRLGVVQMVVVSSPEMARQVLKVHDNLFSNRVNTIASDYLTYNQADMAFAHYSQSWKQMRKICVIKLFSRQRAETWNSVRDEVELLIRAVGTKSGSAVNIGELLFSLARNITYRAAFGSSFQEGQEKFEAILQEFSQLFGALNIADFIPWLSWFDPNGLNPRLEKARNSLDVFIDKVIDDHIQKKKKKKKMGINDGRAESDLVDELLGFCSEDEDSAKVNDLDELKNTIKLTRDNIKGLVMDVMFGGTETVASAIEWVMAELMRNPEELKKVQLELANTVGLNRRVEETDLEKLTYLKCVIKETLRLHPPIPIHGHGTVEDTMVADYFIPAKSRVLINAWAIGRDKDYWDEPETFKPCRFLNEQAPDFKGTNFEFIPFGSGRRSCPGMQLGLYALEVSVAHLIHSFTWELPHGMKPSEVNMNDAFGVTVPRAVRLVAVPSSRLLCPLH